MRFRSLIGPVAAIAIPFLLFEFLTMHETMDHKFAMPRGHFYIVSSVALLSTVIAVAVGVAGSRLRNIKVKFLSLAFISLAEIFAVHGLSTPNFILGVTQLPGIAAQLSIALATLWLWLSSLSSDNPFVKLLAGREKFLLPGWIGVTGLFGIVGLICPGIVELLPLNVNPLKLIFTALTIFLNLITLLRYYHSYRYSQFPLQMAIVYSCGWLIVSQLIMAFGETWRASWWIYHFLLLFSMIVMLIGLVRQYAANRSIAGAMRALFTTDPVERITDCMSPSVKALVLATETKDTYTAGHNFRVTMYALKLAEEMALSPEKLRAIAQGTVIHDVGKIQIPDAVLNKPGRLTPEERGIIEQHPVKGYDMCRSLGFMNEELEIIRWHHEKWDGTGYPDRLAGEQIPLLARIVAVADVYDALTSTRAYRQAWPHSEAMKFLHEHKGTHFDPVCVDAWTRLCERDPSVYLYPLQVMKEDTRVSNLPTATGMHQG
ncbi:HD-GYP domain-containing protein [Paenibacillus hamazuiensis]|uniref:HD-GYP domain-containing protein n=1 Tax=Paenibacillus hamazuiensis TaxID=2936508 RepID=UPI00200EED38|nr:HD-GYP domain-containing protein [Paenibacillus hamazuiensis]